MAFTEILERANIAHQSPSPSSDKWVRVKNTRVTQVGDLLSLGYNEQEAEFMKFAWDFLDVKCLGNHEAPAIYPVHARIEFSGWHHRDRIAEQMVRSKHNAGEYVIAHSVGDWLVTHAGLHPVLAESAGIDITDSAEKIAEQLNTLWVSNPMHEVFVAIGYNRGGYHAYGGVLWNDLFDLDKAYAENPNYVPQICGHSSYADTGMYHPHLWCIDTKGSVAALVTDDDGETFELIESDWIYHYGDSRERGSITRRTPKGQA